MGYRLSVNWGARRGRQRGETRQGKAGLGSGGEDGEIHTSQIQLHRSSSSRSWYAAPSPSSHPGLSLQQYRHPDLDDQITFGAGPIFFFWDLVWTAACPSSSDDRLVPFLFILILILFCFRSTTTTTTIAF
ncbi:hypothetical protein BJ165DRAFT_1487142 [Panaeolus papilionaceus]|nr:hypothetical protein BJ165DRAFT_1487142 [Panaeolus papilionaceus]